MNKVVLVSFADSRYRNALLRLEQYTNGFPFTERHFHTEKNTFTKSYWRRLKPWLYRRGYGYWEWKGELVKQYLDKLSEGDYLVWSDAGVYWNSSETSLKRFHDYLSFLNEEKSVLVFQEPYIEQEWTKGDVLSILDVYDNDDICKTNQMWGGAFIMRKYPASVKLINEWTSINKIEKEYLTDKRSLTPNKKGFKEHRHDQSSFSVLVKRIPHIEIPCNETQVKDNDWSKLRDYPIQARRHKEKDRPLSVIIRNKVLSPWRTLLFYYFTVKRDYFFAGNSYPW